MLEYLKEIRTTITRDTWHTFLFDTLIELRANEACNAIKLHDIGIAKHYLAGKMK